MNMKKFVIKLVVILAFITTLTSCPNSNIKVKTNGNKILIKKIKPISDLKVSTNYKDKIQIRFTPVENATSYVIQTCTVNNWLIKKDKAFKYRATVNQSENEIVYNLENNIQPNLLVRVEARGLGKYNSYSKIEEGTIICPPKNIRSQALEDSIVLTWTIVGNKATFGKNKSKPLYLNNGQVIIYKDNKKVFEDTNDENRFVDNSILPNTKYTYTIKQKINGEEVFIKNIEVISKITTNSLKVSDFKGTKNNNDITLTWKVDALPALPQDAKNIESRFKILRDDKEILNPSTSIQKGSDNTYKFIDNKNLEENKLYTYKILNYTYFTRESDPTEKVITQKDENDFVVTTSYILSKPQDFEIKAAEDSETDPSVIKVTITLNWKNCDLVKDKDQIDNLYYTINRKVGNGNFTPLVDSANEEIKVKFTENTYIDNYDLTDKTQKPKIEYQLVLHNKKANIEKTQNAKNSITINFNKQIFEKVTQDTFYTVKDITLSVSLTPSAITELTNGKTITVAIIDSKKNIVQGPISCTSAQKTYEFNIKDLTPGVNKEYQFVARYNNETEVLTKKINVNVLPKAVIENISKSESETDIILTIKKIEHADSYNIYRDDTKIANTTDLSYTDKPTGNKNGEYKYYVKAVLNNQEGAKSNEETGKLLNLYDINFKAKENTIPELSFKDIQGNFIGYKIQRYVNNNPWGNQIIIEKDPLKANDKTVEVRKENENIILLDFYPYVEKENFSGQEIEYKISLTSGQETKKVTTRALGSPTNFKASKGTENGIVLTWDKDLDSTLALISEYTIYIENNGFYTAYKNINKTETSFTIKEEKYRKGSFNFAISYVVDNSNYDLSKENSKVTKYKPFEFNKDKGWSIQSPNSYDQKQAMNNSLYADYITYEFKEAEEIENISVDKYCLAKFENDVKTDEEFIFEARKSTAKVKYDKSTKTYSINHRFSFNSNDFTSDVRIASIVNNKQSEFVKYKGPARYRNYTSSEEDRKWFTKKFLEYMQVDILGDLLSNAKWNGDGIYTKKVDILYYSINRVPVLGRQGSLVLKGKSNTGFTYKTSQAIATSYTSAVDYSFDYLGYNNKGLVDATKDKYRTSTFSFNDYRKTGVDSGSLELTIDGTKYTYSKDDCKALLNGKELY